MGQEFLVATCRICALRSMPRRVTRVREGLAFFSIDQIQNDLPRIVCDGVSSLAEQLLFI